MRKAAAPHIALRSRVPSHPATNDASLCERDCTQASCLTRSHWFCPHYYAGMTLRRTQPGSPRRRLWRVFCFSSPHIFSTAAAEVTRFLPLAPLLRWDERPGVFASHAARYRLRFGPLRSLRAPHPMSTRVAGSSWASRAGHARPSARRRAAARSGALRRSPPLSFTLLLLSLCARFGVNTSLL